MKIVLNAPFAKTENDLTDTLFTFLSNSLRASDIITIIDNQSELAAATSGPNTFLINGISFADDTPEAIDPNGNRIDIGIAFNDDASRPSDRIIKFVQKSFEGFGHYNISINPPFISSVVGSPDCPTLTIAFRRNLYLDAGTHRMHSTAYKWNHLLNNIYYGIVD